MQNIATSAERFHERLKDPHRTLGEDVIEQWVKRIGGNDSSVFSRRIELAQPGGEESIFRQPESSPAWLDTVEDILRFNDKTCSISNPIAPDDVPFTHLLTRFVEYAVEQVEWSEMPVEFSEEASKGFERWLLDRLALLYQHPLFIEFKTFLATESSEKTRFDEDSNGYYLLFVEQLLDGQLRQFFEEYAVLAKLTVTLVENWVRVIETFGRRLDDDWATLQEKFGEDGTLGRIKSTAFLGDHHENGNRIVKVDFESGTTVAYKPRDVRIGAAFYETVSWINEESTLETLETIDYVTRDGYGWVEWIKFEACEAEEEVEKYYRRCGSLLCLLYALNYTDGNIENLVASGSHPLVVDLETLAVPLRNTEDDSASGSVIEVHERSVLQTGLLPVHHRDGFEGVGGLDTCEGKYTNATVPQFEQTNTDAMELVYGDTLTFRGSNLPQLNNRVVEPEEYHDEIVTGFERTYEFLLENRDELLRGGLLEKFCGARCRYLHRSTGKYSQIISTVRTASYLRSGAMFGCKIEELTAQFIQDTFDPWLWSAYKAEREALWSLDVPRFTVGVCSTDLKEGDQTIEDIFDTTPMEQIRRKLTNLDERDCREQVHYIRAAYAPQTLDDPIHTGAAFDMVTRNGDSKYRRIAEDVFDRVQNTTVPNGAGEPSWIFRNNRREGVSVEYVGDGLFDGRVGIALFCAALWNVTGKQAYKVFATKITSPVAERIENSRPDSSMGAGAFIYGFTKLSEILGDERYLGTARSAVSQLTDSRVRKDSVLDTKGSAGAILGLLAYYEQTGDDDALEIAVAAGDHLLSARVRENGIRVWRTQEGQRPLTGFAHGVTGIAYALVRLADVTGEARFLEAAIESLAFEDERYSPDARNWPDLRDQSSEQYMAGWCNGRAGIGLARLEMQTLFDNEAFKRDLKRALRGTNAKQLSRVDNCCCGTFGRVEFLLRAGRCLDEPRYAHEAEELVENAVRRAEDRGGFVVPWQNEDWYNPSLYGGESGIGYVLLRLRNPVLPCLLTWE